MQALAIDTNAAVNANIANILPTATEALELQRQINELEAKLDPLKHALRDWANGETSAVSVPGFGKVTISKPTPPSSKTVLEADHEAFGRLPPELQRQLVTQGVVKWTHKTSKGSAAKVTISPNV